MKTLPDARADVRRHLDRHMTSQVATHDQSVPDIVLGAPSGHVLWTDWNNTRDWAAQWRRDVSQLPQGVTIEWVTRHLQNRPHGTAPLRPVPVTSRQELPNRVSISGLDAAALFAGDPYPAKLDHTRRRWQGLIDNFPDTADLHALKELADWPQADFDLLLSTAAWFAANPITDSWTPRQVPVPGLHAKWLDRAGRRTLIQRLANLLELNLLPRPAQSRLTYLDPHHAAAGRRRWDIITTGDPVSLPYRPTVVIIIENRDTAFYFPPVIPHGIAVHGDGTAALGLITSIQPLVADGAQLLYWGDIDAAGLRIVAGLRSRGHSITTICMDNDTYSAYSQFGTHTDERGRPIPAGEPTPPGTLSDAEAALYQLLTNPTWPGPRRIEQERITFDEAIRATRAASRNPSSKDTQP